MQLFQRRKRTLDGGLVGWITQRQSEATHSGSVIGLKRGKPNYTCHRSRNMPSSRRKMSCWRLPYYLLGRIPFRQGKEPPHLMGFCSWRLEISCNFVVKRSFSKAVKKETKKKPSLSAKCVETAKSVPVFIRDAHCQKYFNTSSHCHFRFGSLTNCQQTNASPKVYTIRFLAC